LKKPFLKWAGGKYKLLDLLIPEIGQPNNFVDVFTGGCSVSLNVKSNNTISNDINRHLIGLYRSILCNDVSVFTEYFTDENCTEESYNKLRNDFNTLVSENSDSIEKYKLFIYLNKHCFNGLTRFNRSGRFNVPFGRYTKDDSDDKIVIPFSEESIKNIKTEIQNFKNSMDSCTFTCKNFDDMSLYENLGQDDVVYFDPPYLPLNKTSFFTDYFGKFGLKEHEKLSEIATELKNSGIKTVISNSSAVETESIFKEGRFIEVLATRSVGANSETRKKIKEYIIVYD